MHLKYFNDRFSGTLELVLINKDRGIVVVLKSGNADGAKGSSRVMTRWKAVCGETRTYGLGWGKIWR